MATLPRAGNPRIEAFRAFLSTHRRPKTVEAYIAGVSKLEAYCSKSGITAVSTEVLDGWAKELLGTELATPSVHLYVAGVMSYVRWQRRVGILKEDVEKPILPRKRNHQQFIPTEKDLVRFVNAAMVEPEPVATMLQVLPLTGLRAGELCQLTKKDVQVRPTGGRTAVFFRVRAEVSKTREERIVPLHPAGLALFRAYVTQVLPNLPFLPKVQALFPSKTGSFVAPSTLRVRLRKLRRKLGLDKMTPHAFRRWYATTLNRNGVGLINMQRILGHKNPNTTSGYIYQTPEDLMDAVSGVRMPQGPPKSSSTASPPTRRKT